VNGQELLQNVAPLTEAEREEAQAQARRIVAGQRPVLRLVNYTSKYPKALEQSIIVAMTVLLLLVFGASAIKVFSAASATFSEHINSALLSMFVGVAFVGASEIGQVVLTLMLPLTPDRMSKRALLFGIVLCTAIPLVANSKLSGDPLWAFGASDYLWRVLYAYSMPVLSLIGANVLKVILINRLTARYQAQMEHKQADQKWQASYEQAHQASTWTDARMSAFRQVLITVNSKRKHGAVLRGLRGAEWLPLLYRELNADTSWSALLPEAQAPVRRAIPAPVKQAQTSTQQASKQSTTSRAERGGNESTGVLAQAEIKQLANGLFVGVCPVCGKETKQKSNELSARRALAGHQLKHANESVVLPDEEETEEVKTMEEVLSND
jgi:hypothetical protein